MGPELLLITRDRRLADRVKVRFNGRLAVSSSWILHDPTPWPVLIVDISDLSPSDWQHMERWSRRQPRSALVLIDDGCVSRERLARVVADALIPSEADDVELGLRIEEHMPEHQFRMVGEEVRETEGIPHPLGQFLSAAFTHKCTKIGALAGSLGMSQSTLRNQWRAYRSDPLFRLEDVLRRIGHIRNAARLQRGAW
ncbi:MAG: hypothetical protein ACREK1_06185, partial [Longimicrobiales bacterium]